MGSFMKIGDRSVGKGKPTFVIAEGGVNHNGKLSIAKKLIDAAKKAGADAVKFQTFNTERVVVKDAPKAGYQKKVVKVKSHFEMLKDLELSQSDFSKLFRYANRKRIIFLSTPFDEESAEFLYELGVQAFKVGSGEITNLPFLKYLAKFHLPIILSTGMSNLDEVSEGVETIYSARNKRLILLHCTSNYPADFRDANLNAIDTLRCEFDIPVGYSDHTEGCEVALAAVALGACVIEKHFTLNRDQVGPDHKASVEPDQLEELVSKIRKVEESLGDGIKKPAKSESNMRLVARRSLVAVEDIKKGNRFNESMLDIKRPGTGIEPKYFDKIVRNYRANRDIKKDQTLEWEFVDEIK